MELLLAAILAGLLVVFFKGGRLKGIKLQAVWLVFCGTLLQLLVLNLPPTSMPDYFVAIGLVTSQLLLLIFAGLNRGRPGFWLLILGLGLNFLVISLNGGFMPISPELAAKLSPGTALEIGQRFGQSKDIVLPMPITRLEWLSDRFFIATGLTRIAFSLGDIFIAAGAFWVIQTLGTSKTQNSQELIV